MICVVQIEDGCACDDFMARHPKANAYHSSHWLTVISEAYGYKTYCLAVLLSDTTPSSSEPHNGKVVGVLPLVHLKSPIFGNRLVSMPYFDHGGMITENPDYEEKLMQAAINLGRKLKVQCIELRHLEKICCLNGDSFVCHLNDETGVAGQCEPQHHKWSLRSHKVRLLLPLLDSSAALMNSFKSKLRSQINRPIKAGFIAKTGGMELLDDFYHVFSINMRDLGSPVHAKKFPQTVMKRFPEKAKIVVVYKGNEPVASSLMVGFKDVMINPWASALRDHSKDSPNMLLYWRMLAYAADHGYRYFDFGRSTPEEGTYRFKIQWGAKPEPMYWYTVWLNHSKANNGVQEDSSESKKMALAIKLWQKLPVFVSRLIGPIIRKHIDL